MYHRGYHTLTGNSYSASETISYRPIVVDDTWTGDTDEIFTTWRHCHTQQSRLKRNTTETLTILRDLQYVRASLFANFRAQKTRSICVVFGQVFIEHVFIQYLSQTLRLYS